jgi:hypothetical protein
MLKKELGEDLRLDALDRLRASNLQQLPLLGRPTRVVWAGDLLRKRQSSSAATMRGISTGRSTRRTSS